VRLPAFDVDDEADAAGIVLVARVVEALRAIGVMVEPVEHGTMFMKDREAEVKYNRRI
jgi:hypothetical protein